MKKKRSSSKALDLSKIGKAIAAAATSAKDVVKVAVFGRKKKTKPATKSAPKKGKAAGIKVTAKSGPAKSPRKKAAPTKKTQVGSKKR